MNPSVKAAFILIVVFAIGGLAGFVTSKQFDGRPSRYVGPGLDPFRMEKGMITHIEGRLVKSYELTEDQRLGVRKILEDSQMMYEALFRDTRPSLDQIRRAQQTAIRETMTEEQRVRFDKWLEERRKRRDSGREGRSRRDGNGGKDGPRGPRGPMLPPDNEANK